MSTQAIKPRSFEMVTPGEFANLGRPRVQHHDVEEALREMKSMAVGEGVRLKVATETEGKRKRNAALKQAEVLNFPVESMLRDGYLYFRKLKSWKKARA
jgi:hypothetical protein